MKTTKWTTVNGIGAQLELTLLPCPPCAPAWRYRGIIRLRGHKAAWIVGESDGKKASFVVEFGLVVAEEQSIVMDAVRQAAAQDMLSYFGSAKVSA